MRECKILRFINRLLPFGLQVVKWHHGDVPAEHHIVFVVVLGNTFERCVFHDNKYISIKTKKEIIHVVWWCYE